MCTSPAKIQECLFSLSQMSVIKYSDLCHFCISWVLFCIYLIGDEVEHLFWRLRAMCSSIYVNSLPDSVHILYLFFFSWLISFIHLRSFCIQRKLVFCLKYTLKIFIPGFSFNFVYTFKKIVTIFYFF